MRNLGLALLLFGCFLLVSGCSAEPVASESITPPKLDYSTLHIVQHPAEQAILIEGTYFEVVPTSRFTQTSGAPLDQQQLKPGDLVALTAHRETADILPGKGTLISLVRYDDERSQSISKAIAHVIENQDTGGDIIAPSIKAVSSHSVTFQFYDWGKTRKFEGIVNIGSLAFQIKELSYAPKNENP
ncbi:hypothetical protein [Planococcus sp. 107-1]|uniref:hypothetical protein n=1 Tax=Planococcus sp. 107-1 TaxID=2908840 RepID=UPI001F36E265|nr:hypothetical protein [Planococcus sp. 107-1]UJF26418.1 hypothetical protein L0M13_14865 [Planococcus sp. 107-1]